MCLSHSFNDGDLYKYVGNFDTTEEETKLIKDGLEALVQDDYDLLINVCDAISGADGVMDMIDRMNDVKRRYGGFNQEKWDKNLELKTYFEGKMGMDIYEAVDKENFKAVKNNNCWSTGSSMYQRTDIAGDMIMDFHTLFTDDDPKDKLEYLSKLE